MNNILALIRIIIRNIAFLGLFIIILSMEKYPVRGFVVAMIDFAIIGFCLYVDHIEEVRVENNKKWRKHREH